MVVVAVEGCEGVFILGLGFGRGMGCFLGLEAVGGGESFGAFLFFIISLIRACPAGLAFGWLGLLTCVAAAETDG